jgi:hypothetical protein
LLAWISPVIGVVIVEQKLETKFSGVPGHGDGVLEIVGKSAGRMKQPETDPAVAVILENLQPRSRGPVVLEDYPLVF